MAALLKYSPISLTSASESRAGDRRRAGFSLTELLVVIGIIVLLMGILLVAIGKVQSKARRTQTENTMRQFSNACMQFQTEHGRFPGIISEVVLGDPATFVNGVPKLSSTENAMLDLTGGTRLLTPTDQPRDNSNSVYLDYQNYKAAATVTNSMIELIWPVAGGSDYELVIDTRRIGDGPVINGKPHAPYFTPGAGNVGKAKYPNGTGDPSNEIPDLLDAWGDPILYLRQLRDRGPLVADANNTPAPQFLRAGVLPYIESNSLGELGKNQTNSNGNQATSILNSATDRNATLGKILEHPAIAGQARGGFCLISAGPDGIFYSRVDGPGSEAVGVDDITSPPLPANDPKANPKVIDDYDDIRMFGGA